MAEKYDQIIDLVDKYYYFIVSPKKVILLSSSNDLGEAKKLAIEKLEPKIEQFIGKKLIFVKIINTYTKFKDKNTNELGLIGGPIAFEFLSGLVENKKKIVNEKEIGNNKYYLSKKYIKENIDNISQKLQKVVKKYISEYKTKNFMDVSIL
jgi:hypothetical protein